MRALQCFLSFLLHSVGALEVLSNVVPALLGPRSGVDLASKAAVVLWAWYFSPHTPPALLHPNDLLKALRAVPCQLPDGRVAAPGAVAAANTSVAPTPGGKRGGMMRGSEGGGYPDDAYAYDRRTPARHRISVGGGGGSLIGDEQQQYLTPGGGGVQQRNWGTATARRGGCYPHCMFV